MALTWRFASWTVSLTREEFDAECRSARPDRYRTAMCCRLVGGSRSPVVAEFAEGAGELAAQPLVLVSEFAVAAVRDFEATSQGVVAGALLGGYRCARLGSALVAESADLVGECPTGDANRPASSITFVIQELCGAPFAQTVSVATLPPFVMDNCCYP